MHKTTGTRKRKRQGVNHLFLLANFRSGSEVCQQEQMFDSGSDGKLVAPFPENSSFILGE